MEEPKHARYRAPAPRSAKFVCFARALDGAVSGAELVAGEEPGHI